MQISDGVKYDTFANIGSKKEPVLCQKIMEGDMEKNFEIPCVDL